MLEPDDVGIHKTLGQCLVLEVNSSDIKIRLISQSGAFDTHVVKRQDVIRIGSVTTENIMSKNKLKQRADELVDKNIVGEDEGKTLKAMIDSPDDENFDLAHELISLKIEEKLIEPLNDGQTAAFISIASFFRDREEDALVLKGYAGTGKTFLVNKIIEYITVRFPHRRIAITAPTNKAVQVLMQSGLFIPNSTDNSVFNDLFDSSQKVSYNTIHKLLGLTESIDGSGNQTFKAKKKDKNELRNYKYLIVDEVSMLDDTLCTEIMKHSKNVNIIFMGDPAQIPPINRVDCIPFKEDDEYKFKRVMLDEIMRQKKGNPIVETSFILRENLTTTQPIRNIKTKLTDEGHGVFHIDSDKTRHLVREMLKEYFVTDEFKADANYAKVLAWRNATVNYMNGVIREMLYGKDIDPWMVGEKLVCNKAVFELGRNKFGSAWVIQFTTSQELEIADVNIVKHKYHEGGYSMNAAVYQCKVKCIDPENGVVYQDVIRIMHEDSMERWQELLTESKKQALAMRESRLWVKHYNIQKWSANVGYNYAITCHKSQGSTYKNVLLIEEDVDRNKRTVERNRIKYTAYTRPTDKLYILRKNYE